MRRYFSPKDSGFRIKKAIRDLLIFSEQDVLKDPPFSRLDLLACRNLLIYLGPELQKRLVPLFFYALRPEGLLFLGNSEGVGDADGLFVGVDRKARIYRRKQDDRAHRPSHAHLAVSVPLPEAAFEKRPAIARSRWSPRELTEQALLQQLAPPSALVDAAGDVHYLRGRTGLFLEPSPGESPGSNILKMAREGLRTGLSSTLRRAVSTLQPAHCEGLQVKTNGHHTFVDLSVHPVNGEGGPPLFLVMMREAAPATASAPPVAAVTTREADDARIAALKQELRAKEEFLQRTNEELESSSEELKSSNEEMQSVNEELQSTNEELQTSKEELQSVNEELATVNTELQTKVLDLSRANSDMNNLLAGTGIGTVFVDRELKILRFTPAASAITNLIQGDVGRPVGHIVSNLVGYPTLVSDAQRVLDTLHSHEVDVRSTTGRWYTLRMQPYRTIENVIEGVVMSFTDITQAVATREALKKVNEVLRLAVVVRDATDAVTVRALDGRTLAWNPGAVRLFGWTEAEALTMNLRQRVPAFARAQEQSVLDRLRRGEQVPAYETDRTTKTGELIKVTVVATALNDETGDPYGIATTERAEASVGKAAAVPAPGS
jgi:two-component system CheB/CheR fusion protein